MLFLVITAQVSQEENQTLKNNWDFFLIQTQELSLKSSSPTISPLFVITLIAIILVGT